VENPLQQAITSDDSIREIEDPIARDATGEPLTLEAQISKLQSEKAQSSLESFKFRSLYIAANDVVAQLNVQIDEERSRAGKKMAILELQVLRLQQAAKSGGAIGVNIGNVDSYVAAVRNLEAQNADIKRSYQEEVGRLQDVILESRAALESQVRLTRDAVQRCEDREQEFNVEREKLSLDAMKGAVCHLLVPGVGESEKVQAAVSSLTQEHARQIEIVKSEMKVQYLTEIKDVCKNLTCKHNEGIVEMKKAHDKEVNELQDQLIRRLEEQERLLKKAHNEELENVQQETMKMIHKIKDDQDKDSSMVVKKQSFKELGDMAIEIQTLKLEHAAAITKAQNEALASKSAKMAALEQEVAGANEKYANLQSYMQSKLQDVTSANKQTIESLKSEHSQQIAAVSRIHAKKIEEFNDSLDQIITALKLDHVRQIDVLKADLRSQHSSKINELTLQHIKELHELGIVHEAEVHQTRQQMATSYQQALNNTREADRIPSQLNLEKLNQPVGEARLEIEQTRTFADPQSTSLLHGVKYDGLANVQVEADQGSLESYCVRIRELERERDDALLKLGRADADQNRAIDLISAEATKQIEQLAKAHQVAIAKLRRERDMDREGANSILETKHRVGYASRYYGYFFGGKFDSGAIDLAGSIFSNE